MFLTVPQTILICLIMLLLFRFIRNYEISVFIRRYCFFSNFFQIVLEPNIGFFTFIFFNQTKMFFSFAFLDKFWLCISVMVWGIVLLFCFCFYFLTDYLYKVQAGYFLHHYYRTFPGLVFLTFRMTVRGFLKGIIHSLFHENYPAIIICLSVLELLTFLLSLYTEYRYQVNLTRIQWMTSSIYHFLIILLNLGLYLETM